MLGEALKNTADGKSLFIAPILDTFAELFSSTEVMNKDSIGAAIAAIDDLIKHFAKGKGLLLTTFTAEKALLLKKIAHHDVIIDDLTKTKIPNKNTEMDNNEAAQKDKKAQVDAAKADLKVEEDNLDAEEAAFVDRTTLNTDLNREYQHELDIVKQAT